MAENKIITLADDEKLTVKMETTQVIGTDDYNLLLNIPKINGVEVKGEKSLDDYDIKKKSEADAQHTAILNAINAETSRAENAENANADAISAETSRAQTAEKTNAAAIAKETTDRSTAISAETSRAQAAEKANSDAMSSHTGSTSNPHKVTKAQVGLSNVDNTADAVKSVKNAQTVNGHTVNADVPANAKFTDTNTTYSNATTSYAGLMSASDKAKLDNLSNSIGAITTTQIDSITNS